MQDLACQHGHTNCDRCVEDATERARQVSRFYEAESKRDQVRVLRSPGARFDPIEVKRCACGSRLSAYESIVAGECVYCRTRSPQPWVDRCKCGTGLMAQKSIDTGKCFDCRNPPATWAPAATVPSRDNTANSFRFGFKKTRFDPQALTYAQLALGEVDSCPKDADPSNHNDSHDCTCFRCSNNAVCWCMGCRAEYKKQVGQNESKT